jgi:hypothetical protein
MKKSNMLFNNMKKRTKNARDGVRNEEKYN